MQRGGVEKRGSSGLSPGCHQRGKEYGVEEGLRASQRVRDTCNSLGLYSDLGWKGCLESIWSESRSGAQSGSVLSICEDGESAISLDSFLGPCRRGMTAN